MKYSGKKFLQIAAYLIITFIFVMVLGITRDCGRIQYKDIEGFSRGDTIDIGLMFSPGSYYIYGDTLAGINKEIAEVFSKQSEIPIKLWPVNDPASGLMKLEEGNFDILASLPLDNNVKTRFPVSESIFLDRLVLVQLKDTINNTLKIKSSLDLEGDTIFIPEGSSAAQRIKNLSQEIGGKIEIIETPELSDELLCLQVANGTIPLAIVNERVAKTLSGNFPAMSYDNSISFTQFQVWLFNPSDSLLYQKFNSWFEDFRLSQEYRKIINTY